MNFATEEKNEQGREFVRFIAIDRGYFALPFLPHAEWDLSRSSSWEIGKNDAWEAWQAMQLA